MVKPPRQLWLTPLLMQGNVGVAVAGASCFGLIPIEGLGRLSLQHGSSFVVAHTCPEGEKGVGPHSFKQFQLLGKTLSFTIDLSKVGCNHKFKLSLVPSPAVGTDGKPSKGTCPESPYACGSDGTCGQWCPEVTIMEANSYAFSAAPHRCDAPSSEGHFTKCDHAGCDRSTHKMGGAAYGPGATNKIDTRRPIDVHAEFHGSGLWAGNATFTGMTVTLQQHGSKQHGSKVVLDFSGCGNYFTDLAASMAQGMAMRLSHRKRPSTGKLAQGEGTASCSKSSAGEANIADVKIANACNREITIKGFGTATFMSGRGTNISGDDVSLEHNSALGVTTTCSNHWDPSGFALFKVLGKTLSFVVDLSKVGCTCNLALYLINGPPKDEMGQPAVGTCSWSPYYCDSNGLCGEHCPEVDIMEANSGAFAATPHKCDAPSLSGHHGSCDRKGCSHHTASFGARAYGPAGHYRINTLRPFEVHTSFHEASRPTGRVFAGMTTVLRQGHRELTLDHRHCSSYIEALTAPLLQGMILRISYWGQKASTMAWLDSPVCSDEDRCDGVAAGKAVIGNITISDLDSTSMQVETDSEQGGTAGAWFGQPWLVALFVLFLGVQCFILSCLFCYAASLFQWLSGILNDEARAVQAEVDSPMQSPPLAPTQTIRPGQMVQSGA